MKMDGTKIVYEVGDWVMPTENVARWNRGDSFPCRIREINGDCAYCNDVANSCYMGNLRLATQEEINQATQEEKIMVRGRNARYEVEFDYYFGCGEVGKAKQLKISCVEIDKELFLKIGKKAGWL